MKKFDGENILKLRMMETTDKLLSTEPGTIEQSLLFLEFYLFERFRLLHLVKECDYEDPDEYARWRFLTKKLKLVERKIAEEKEQISIFEEITNQNLTQSSDKCKIYNMEKYKKGEDDVE